MLEPKTKIFIPRSPHKLKAALVHDARRCGARGSSAIHFLPTGGAPLRLARDDAAPPSSPGHSGPLHNPRLGGTVFLRHSMASIRAEYRKPALQKPGWWESRPAHWHIAGVESAAQQGSPRTLAVKKD